MTNLDALSDVEEQLYSKAYLLDGDAAGREAVCLFRRRIKVAHYKLVEPPYIGASIQAAWEAAFVTESQDYLFRANDLEVIVRVPQDKALQYVDIRELTAACLKFRGKYPDVMPYAIQLAEIAGMVK